MDKWPLKEETIEKLVTGHFVGVAVEKVAAYRGLDCNGICGA